MIQGKEIFFECDNMCFLLDESNFTATIIDISETVENVFIPRSIVHNSHEYIIEIISVNSLKNSKIKSVSFAKDSQVKVFDDLSSFYMLQSLEIPSSVTKLGENWCYYLNDIVSISISPKNKFFTYFDEKMILSKLDEQSEAYESIVYARRDIEAVMIPSFIKKINKYSFSHCPNLTKIEFSENSELIEICEFAFDATSIKKIKIPSKVTCIKNSTFADCYNLRTVEFEENSQLTTIERFSFAQTSIENLQFPSKLENLKKRWCFDTVYLYHIIISPDNNYFKFITDKLICRKSNKEENVFDAIVFALRDIESVVIPSFVKKIKSSSFSDCNYLEKIEFPDDSQLTSIGYESFSSGKFKSLLVPKNVSKIKKEAFVCSEIETIEILGENILIGSQCFNSSNLWLISFPNANKVVVQDNHIPEEEDLQLFIAPKGIIEVQVIW